MEGRESINNPFTDHTKNIMVSIQYSSFDKCKLMVQILKRGEVEQVDQAISQSS